MQWLKSLWLRARRRDDLSEEIKQHLAEKAEELIAGGVPREEAEYRASSATLLASKSAAGKCGCGR